MRAADLNAVAVFVKVAEMKSFRAAAAALRVPRSTASLKVAQLEDRLGARLLERTTRALRLTDAGRAYYQQAAPALGALEAAGRAVGDMQAEPSGRLRITTPVELGQLVLGDVLAAYLERHPGVEVEAELLNRPVDLIEEGFDLAIRPGELPDSTLIARKLGRPQRLRLYASPAYLRRRGEPRRPEDLGRHDCLVLHTRSTTWDFRGTRAPRSVAVRARVAANSLVVLRDLAVAGRGIARLPEFFGAAAVRARRLRTVLDEFAPPPVYVHALYPSARNVSPTVRALLALLEERSAAWPGDARSPS